MRAILILPALLALAACEKADNQPGPGGVTVGEAKALDDAAAMIEDQRLTRDALPSPTASRAPVKSMTPAAKPAGAATGKPPG
ncbi:MAG: hypothetical protein KGM18_10815 [Sphingomonadales bacterium]|nr:hypothetical protein [Sphingomonadales bacterium]